MGYRQLPLLCHALSVFERSGTASMESSALQFEMYRLGTRVGVECGSDEAAVHVSGIDDNFGASVALLHDWLAQPKLQDRLVAEAVESTLSERRNQLDHDQVISSALRKFVYFGDDSVIVWGNLDAVDEAALRALVRRLAERPAFVTVVGDVSKIDLDQLAKIGQVSVHEPEALFSYGAF